MKKKDIWISIAVIAVAALVLRLYLRQEGQIKIDTPGVKMRLRAGWFGRTSVQSGSDPVAASARAYRPQRITIEAKQGNDIWRIVSSRGPWGDLAKIKVGSNKTTVVELGPPFVVKPQIHRLRGRSQLGIGLAIVGKAGEHYSSRITKNGRHLPAPRLRVVDERGNVLASGKFEYG
jgi:hypothetical protein